MRNMQDKHVIEALGKTRITIEDGEITDMTTPEIDYCPIFNKYHNIEKLTEEKIRENINFRIKKFGMCTKDRKVRLDDMLSVGISEILKTNRQNNNIDCVVGVCEGTGTLIMTDPEIIQGVGGRVSALISTTPIPEVIEKVGTGNVLDPVNTPIDPVGGIRKAADEGYENIAVTLLPSAQLINKIRQMDLPGYVNVTLHIAHTTSAREEDVKASFEYADIISGCASSYVHRYARENKSYYYGDKVSVYAVSEKGREMLDNRLKSINRPPSVNIYPQDTGDIPEPLK